MGDRPIIFSRDPVKKRVSDGAYKERHRERINAKRRAEYAAEPDKHRAKQAAYRASKYADVLAYNKKWATGYRGRLRSEMIAAFGGTCSCCGEAEPKFLQLDHVNNDGYLDRKIHKTSNKLFASLKRAGWPKERHQLLCANCNFGKLLNGGVCPHEEARRVR